MSPTPHLLDRYASLIASLSPNDLKAPHSIDGLRLHRATGERDVEMIYAPFDHVNMNARVVIVGMTPGHFQAVSALVAARSALVNGCSVEEAAALAKVHASFSGEPMRGNLIRMMDRVGIAKWLGISSTSALWDEAKDIVHFTSALRYPVFVGGQNWSGQPDMVRANDLRTWLERYTGTELAVFRDALIVPLGPKVTKALHYLASKGMCDSDRILDGLPHPSGQNGERIAYFLGDKSADRCSAKTNTVKLDASRAAMIEKIGRL